MRNEDRQDADFSPDARGRRSAGLRNIVLLGLVSLFMDASTEMVYPLIPLYLTSAFGATPALVGVIEGVAESLASLLKVFSGHIADKRNRKKPLAIFGYGTAIVYKLALIVASSWPGILAARVIDKLGKGVRTAPRDVLVSQSAAAGRQGAAFGLHKTLDMAGSAIGILAAYLLMRATGGDVAYKRIFALAIIPAIVSVSLLFLVREENAPAPAKTQRTGLIAGWRQLDGRLRWFLVTAFLFNLGNSSNAFLLLRAYDVGFDTLNVTLLYLLYNVTSSAFALPFGRLSDRLGRRNLLVAGYLLFAATYTGFAVAKNAAAFVALFFVYGLYTALTSGVERALIAEIAPPAHKGAMLGLHGTLVGVALLPASVIAGFLWNRVSPAAPFLFGALLSLVSAAAIAVILRARSGAAPEAGAHAQSDENNG